MAKNILPCPKCSGRSWVEQTAEGDWHQKCHCGYLGFLMVTKDGVTIMKSGVPASETVLPRKDTKIHRCLMGLASHYPRPARTAMIATAASLERAETSSLLMALMATSLVERTEERKGKDGGSVWKLSAVAENILFQRSR